MLKVETIKERMEWGLLAATKKLSVESVTTYEDLDNEAKKLLFSTPYLKTLMSPYKTDEVKSLTFLGSDVAGENEQISLVMTYQIKIPFAVFPINVKVKQKFTTRAYCGVEQRTKDDIEDTNVYITSTGKVYHMKSDCTYLKLSIWQVLFEDIDHLRNSSGGKYKLCTTCFGNAQPVKGQKVYVCNYGVRFHSNATCRKIKRTVKKIKLSDVGKRTPCSKCVED